MKDKTDLIALTELVKKAGGEIIFKGTIITVEDPDIDTDFGSSEVGIESLRYDEGQKTLYADGAPYDRDAGARLEDAEPIDVYGLNAEEIASLLETAKQMDIKSEGVAS